MATSATTRLTNVRTLANNTIWNFLGQAAPLVFGVLVIPALVHNLGTARFGILTLVWAVIGYSSLFDLGLGRALTKLVAEKLGQRQEKELPALIWTGLGLMFGTGVLGMLIMLLASPLLATHVLHIPSNLQHETIVSFYEIAIAIPIVIATTGLRGILEAQQLFGPVNAVRVMLGIFTFIGPWAALFISNSLVTVVAVLLCARVLAGIAQLLIVFKHMPQLRHERRRDPAAIPALLKFGGWMTVTNVLGPIMVNLDRFFIGAFSSVSAVAYYATPYEVVTKLWIVPSALSGVLFPAFSTVGDKKHLCRLFERGLNYVFLILFVPILLVVTLAPAGMNLWLGQDFAQKSSLILQLLGIGVFVNSLASIPFAFLQGIGRPDVTAKLHFSEFMLYVPAAIWSIGKFGIIGAAILWDCRVLIDAVALLLFAVKIVPQSGEAIRRVAIRMASAIFVFVIGVIVPGISIKAAFLLVSIVVFGWTAWSFIVPAHERNFLVAMLRFDTLK